MQCIKVLLFYTYRYCKKLYPKFNLDFLSATNASNGVSFKDGDADLELKEKTERPVFLSQPVLLSEVEEPPIQQTSFCEHWVTLDNNVF